MKENVKIKRRFPPALFFSSFLSLFFVLGWIDKGRCLLENKRDDKRIRNENDNENAKIRREERERISIE